MPTPQNRYYTEEDYYEIPEDVRAELIDGQIYYQAAPSRIHQEILSDLLNLYANAGVLEYWIVNPIKKMVFVYYLEETNFEDATYTFADTVKVNIYEDLSIDFSEL